ncbi:hypothetical protein Syun_025977 [Stephania yunnanensis]|uniref:Isochorismatase-like domain-containing protein n=1 Tax=Stephania yunnanensis TaxID=152371 RepID=A0AAP0EVK2_9MAGN
MAEKWKKTALLVLHMQVFDLKDYLAPDSPYCMPAGRAIIPSVKRAVDVARERSILVVWVVREHDYLGRDVELFRRHHYGVGKTGPVIKGTPGAGMIDGLEVREEDYKLVKNRFSSFLETNLHSLLQSAGIDSIVVVGIQTPNCIRQTVFDAVSLDYPYVTVIVDATAAETPEVHDANIFDMKNIGVEISTLEEWCQSKRG